MGKSVKYERTRLDWKKQSNRGHDFFYAQVNNAGDEYTIEHVDPGEYGYGREGWLLTYPNGDRGGLFTTGPHVTNPKTIAQVAAEAHLLGVLNDQDTQQ
ncbi:MULTISPECIES: hypothetical protein [Rhodococcus]|uniref:hypothetical protein n=1 Tax=Rhodococcus TaxID=1827 RepID=UPI000A89CC72|nr:MULTISPECIES: hypothetical protein [Rhodococcus]MCF8786149.1 hypothetical protein [Rhodococcus ruber]UTM40273.1 hypothetical protein MX572_25540 [Rhodococcus pyridinivorans]